MEYLVIENQIKIVLVINKPEREMGYLNRIGSAIYNVNSNTKVYYVEYRDPDLISKILDIEPQLIMTFPLTAISTSYPFYILKKLLNIPLVCFMTEGLVPVNNPSRIRKMVGLENYGANLVDYHICWGPRTKNLIANELLIQKKISSENRVLCFGHPAFEVYFEPDENFANIVPENIFERINNYSRSATILFVTGFQFADYSPEDLIRAGDLVRMEDNNFKQKLQETYDRVMKFKVFRNEWIEQIVNCAQANKDILFIVKMHPGEINRYKHNKSEFPYKEFAKFKNILLIDFAVPIRSIFPFCSLLFHYGSTTMLEAYLFKIPTVFVKSQYVNTSEPLPTYKNDNNTKITELAVTGVNSTFTIYPPDIPSVVSNHKKANISYKRKKVVEKILKDQLNIDLNEKYKPSHSIATFLLSIDKSNLQTIEDKDTFLNQAVNAIGINVFKYLCNKGEVLYNNKQYKESLTSFNKAYLLANILNISDSKLNAYRSNCLYHKDLPNSNKDHQLVSKINICYGLTKISNFINIGLHPGADINIDLEKLLLPFPDNFADVIVCFSSISYFSRNRALQIIKDVHRVLKPGGITYFGSHDLRILVDKYYNRDTAFYSKKLTSGKECFPGKTLAEKLNNFFYRLQEDGKKCEQVYDYESLALLFKIAGFNSIHQKQYHEIKIPEFEHLENISEILFFLEASKS